jgi:hypothetical protein
MRPVRCSGGRALETEGDYVADVPHRWTGRSGRLAAGGVLALLVVVLVAWLVLRGDDDGAEAGSPTGSASPTGSGASVSGQSTLPTGNPTAPQPSASPPVTRRPSPVRASLGARAKAGSGVAVAVTRIDKVRGTARGVGQTAAPALRFTVEVRNPAKKPVNLDLAVVNAYFGPNDSPASPLSGPGAKALPQTLAGGATARGRYVFAVPVAERGRVRLEFSYSNVRPTVVFTGSAG